MKDQYTCDINDFEKYAILRELSRATDLPPLLVWMLTARDETKHGNNIDYLDDPKTYRPHDPELFDVLNRIVETGARSTLAIEQSGILGAARFIRSPLQATVASRSKMMDAWREEAAASPALSFFDPDNGLVRGRLSKGSAESERYLYDDELAEAYAASAVLVTFQWRPRYTAELDLVGAVFDRVRAVCDPALLLALHNGRVAHMILAQPEHAAAVRDAAEGLARRWGGQLRLTISSSGMSAGDPRPAVSN